MIRKTKNGIAWLEFEILAEFPEVVHGVFLRHGGVSEGIATSLNVSLRAGDLKENVCENRRRILNVLPLQSFVTAKQVHREKIYVVEDLVSEVDEFDGLATNLRNIGLFINHADCQAAIFYDPVKRVCANVHAGWRGQVKNIYGETLRRLKDRYGTDLNDVRVAISPSLGPESSEFVNYKTEFPKNFYPFQVKPNYFDLWAIAKHQLQECGVLAHHIQIAGIDTVTNPADFFSYRRAVKEGKGATGCHATVVGIRL